jgi:hypothetical protein
VLAFFGAANRGGRVVIEAGGRLRRLPTVGALVAAASHTVRTRWA